MEEKDIKRLKELQAKDGTGDMTTAEQEEYDVLCERKELSSIISRVVSGEVKKEIGELKSKVDAIAVDKSEDIEKNPSLRMHGLVSALYHKDAEGIKRLQGTAKLKVADPMLAAGSVLIPTITEARIIELQPTYGQARQYMESVPMTGLPITVPKESTNPTWTWGIDENTSIATSKPTLGSVSWTPKKGGVIVVLTKELFTDAIVSVGDYIIRKVAQAKGQSEDIQFFRGTGSPFTGIFNTGLSHGGVRTTATTNVNSLTYEDLLNAMINVDQNYIVGAAWHFHRSILPFVWGIKDTVGQPIFRPADGNVPASLMGMPIRLIEGAPTATAANATPLTPFILFGNPQNSTIRDVVDSNQVKILEEATIDGTNLAQYDLVGIRVLARAAFNANLVEKYSIIRTHA